MIAELIFAATLATTTFRGTVVVRHHGVEDAVGGAIVELDWDYQPLRTVPRAITATDGSFEFPDVVVGEHTIRIHSNYDPIAGDIYVVPQEREIPRRFIVLEPTCWAVYGRVRDSSTSEPVANATIYYLGTGNSDTNGDYFIDWNCGSVSFRFHNTIGIFAHAPGYFDFNHSRRPWGIGELRQDLDFNLRHLPVHSPCCGHGPEPKIK